MNRFVSKDLCIMDKLSYSAQMRILILANGSSTLVGERVKAEKKATPLKSFRVDPPTISGSHPNISLEHLW